MRNILTLLFLICLSNTSFSDIQSNFSVDMKIKPINSTDNNSFNIYVDQNFTHSLTTSNISFTGASGVAGKVVIVGTYPDILFYDFDSSIQLTNGSDSITFTPQIYNVSGVERILNLVPYGTLSGSNLKSGTYIGTLRVDYGIEGVGSVGYEDVNISIVVDGPQLSPSFIKSSIEFGTILITDVSQETLFTLDKGGSKYYDPNQMTHLGGDSRGRWSVVGDIGATIYLSSETVNLTSSQGNIIKMKPIHHSVITMPSRGYDRANMGGTLTIPPNTQPGSYSGDFTLVFNY